MTDSGSLLITRPPCELQVPIFGRPGLLNQTITPSPDRYLQVSSSSRPTTPLHGSDLTSYRERYAVCPLLLFRRCKSQPSFLENLSEQSL